MATLYLDPQSDGIIVTTPKGRAHFPADATVAELIDHLLSVSRGQATPKTDSLGVSMEAKAALAWEGPVLIGPPDPKLRRPKPKRVSISLEELLA